MRFMLFFLLTVLASACSDSSSDSSTCENEVFYKEPFSIEIDQCYRFEDGTELSIDKLINEFCPCDVECIWGGQIKIEMKWVFEDGEELDYVFNGDFPVMPNDTLPNGLTILHDNMDIEFEVACDEDNPSPNILSTKLVVNF